MKNIITLKWLWGQLSYVIPLLVGAALVAHRMPKKKHFGLRVFVSCFTILAAKMLLDIVLIRKITYGSTNTWVMVNLMLSVLLYLLVSLCTTWCFECDLFAGLFCGTIGYSLQHIAQRLYMIFSYSSIPSNAVLNGVVLTLITILVYIIIYLVMLRKVRFCTVIVDNKLQIAISTIFIMATIFLDQFILNAAASYAQRVQIIIMSVATCMLGIMLEMSNMSSKNIELQRDIAARLRTEEREKFSTDKAIIDLLNIKAHDLKHQITASNLENNAAMDETIAVLQAYEELVQTGNEALDAILAHKLRQATEMNIKLTFMVDGEKLSFIRDIDIYSLFGNILDNAIEAVKQLDDVDKRIVSVSVTSQEYFVSISATNFFSGTINIADGLPKTTKVDRLYHGFGLQSIKMLTEKYQGDLNISVKEDIFTLDILFPL